MSSDLARFLAAAVERLQREDPRLFALLEAEYRRQASVLTMVASSSIADPSALVCEALPAMNVTAEGYPGARFHAGCVHVDAIERLAIERAQHAFGARYANVQPSSATAANMIVQFAVLAPGDVMLGLDLDSGGHLTHGAKVALSGRVFRAVGYGLTREERIDYDQAERLAEEHRPKLIVCGTTAHPRQIDWARFRAIADEVGAYLLADITHVAGLVAAGLHPSPLDHAHFTTTCTHKQLYGGRGGLILCGKDFEQRGPHGALTLAELVQKRTFPFFQGAPNMSAIAAKARGLAYVATAEFREVAERILVLSRALAAAFGAHGERVITGGTDNHIVVVDVFRRGLTGVNAEKALEACGIVVNKNRIPHDVNPPTVTSGIRLGTNGLAIRALEPADMLECVELIERVFDATRQDGERSFRLDPLVRAAVEERVQELCLRRPFRTYPEPLGHEPAPAARAA
jgi:glycine hydroxymethyltransferase